jgi:hypothetical protein
MQELARQQFVVFNSLHDDRSVWHISFVCGYIYTHICSLFFFTTIMIQHIPHHTTADLIWA